jgi:hypothetical protein
VTAAHAPLAVSADLSLRSARGETIAVTAGGAVITVTLPRLRLASAFGAVADRRSRAMLLAGLHRGLQAADLTLQVEVRRRVVARLSPRSRPTLLSRLLGLGALQLRPLSIGRALLGRSAGQASG